MSNLGRILGVGSIAIFAVAGVTGIDYELSQSMRWDTARVVGKIVKEDKTYKTLSGNHTTAKDNLSGKIGTFVSEAFNYGNSETSYTVQLQELRYRTSEGFFFSGEERIKQLGLEKIVVISKADLANVGDTVEFNPVSHNGFMRRAYRGSRRVVLQDETYPAPIVNPPGLKKIN